MIQTRLSDTGTTMKTSSVITIILTTLTAAVGCSYTPPNPCDPGILHDHLSDEQLDSCEECNDATGCIDGSTGEDEPEVGTLSCYAPLWSEVAQVWNAEFCHVGWEIYPSTYSKEAGTCTLRHPGFPCSGNWAGDFKDECVLCEPMKPDNVGWPLGAAVATSNDGWNMCGWSPGELTPATMITPGDMSSDWPSKIGCLYEDIIQAACAHGFVAIGEANPSEATFTCRCPNGSDDSCQEGAVCEQGYQIEDGKAKPTLCTWDDGTPNGIAPEGPVVYGVDAWADGIIVDGDRVTMTAQFFIKASTGAIFNDDQGFGALGELTQIGPDSLAAHIGLSLGDIFDGEQADIDVLARSGGPVEIDVISVSGDVRTLTVSVE